MDDQENEPRLAGDEPDFRSELVDLLNKHSMENRSDTPDWILRDFMCSSLRAFDMAVNKRTEWYRPK